MKKKTTFKEFRDADNYLTGTKVESSKEIAIFGTLAPKYVVFSRALKSATRAQRVCQAVK